MFQQKLILTDSLFVSPSVPFCMNTVRYGASRFRTMQVLLERLMVLLLVANKLSGLNPDKALTEYGITSWGGSEALPSVTIKSVLQTHDGYLWMATNGGLVRFDGSRFVNFSKSNSGLAANELTSLWETASGTLWIGLSGGGICQLKQSKFSCLGADTGLPAGEVRSVIGDEQGGLWIGIVGAGIAYLREGHFRRLTTADGLPSNNVTRLRFDRDGALWITTYDAGVAVYKDRHFHTLARPILPSNLVWNVTQDRSGAIWLATFGGLCRLKSAFDPAPHIFTTADGLPGNNTLNVYVDRSQKIWVVTDDGGLSRLDGSRFTSLTINDGLADMSVLALTEDREGNMWVGTKSGLNRLRDESFSVIGAREGLAEDAVRIVFEDSQRNLWVGTYKKGLERVSHDGLRIKPERVPLKDCSPLAAYTGNSEALWLGCAGGGIMLLKQNRQETRYALGSSHRFVEVNAIAALGGRRLFAATFGLGLAEFRDNAWHPNSVKSSAINVASLLGGKDGLWAATLDHDLFRINPDGSLLDFSAQLGTLTANNLSRDSDGSVWVELEHGLAHVDGDTLRVVQLGGTQMADDQLYNLIDDERGFYWISSSRGIYRIPRSDLQAMSRGNLSTHPPVLYGFADGVKATNYVGFAQPTSCRTQDGRLWFATTRGLLSVDPSRVRINAVPPPVHVEGILADDRLIPGKQTGGELQVSPDRHRLEIQYTALSLTVPEKVRFSYRLEGFDADWVDARQRRSAFYTDLPPGHYRFRVKASNNDGIWNQEGAEIAFYKQPFYYQTIWFQMFCFGVIAFLGWISYQRNLRRVRREISLVEAAIANEQQKAAREKLVKLAEANRVLRRSASKLTMAVGSDQFLGVFLREAMDLAGAAAGAVFRRIGQTEFVFASLIQDGIELRGAALAALPCAQEKQSVSRADSSGYFSRLAAGEIIRTRIDDASALCPPLALQYHREHGHITLWDCPFSVNDRVEGAIALAFRTHDIPSEEVFQTLTALNSQLAIALELTRLSEEGQRTALALEREKTLAEERSRVAREIHDTLAHCFTGILMQLQAASEYFHLNSRVAASCVERAETLARDGLQQARTSVMTISPIEAQIDLVEGIRSTIGKSFTGTRTDSELVVVGPEQPLNASTSVNALRICQEALSNTQRYADAKHVTITLRFTGDLFAMEVKDDGVGFSTQEAAGLGFGLNGMQTRASRIGGRVSIQSEVGAGTTVLLEVPMQFAKGR